MNNTTTLTLEAVEQATLLLLQAHPNNTTTTWEVKTLLRYLNFWAEQDQVANFMKEISEDEDSNLDFTVLSGTTYRTYYLISAHPETEDTVISTFQFSNVN